MPGPVRRHDRRAPVEAVAVLPVLGRAPDLQAVVDAIVQLAGDIAELRIGVVDKALVVEMADVEAVVEAVDQRAAAGAVAGAIAVEGIVGGEGLVDDRTRMRRLGHVVDGAAGGAEARHQRVRSLDDLDLLQACHIHGAAGHGRRPDRDAVVEGGELVAGEAAHREDRGRAGRIAAGHADRSFGDIGGGPDAPVLHGLLADDLDGRGRLACRDAEAGGDPGDGGSVQRCLHRSARGLGDRPCSDRCARLAARDAACGARLLISRADGGSRPRGGWRDSHGTDLHGRLGLGRALRDRCRRQDTEESREIRKTRENPGVTPARK